MKVSKGLTQAYQLQDFLYASLMSIKDQLAKDGKLTVTRDDATSITQLVRAWESCQERVRIHRGKPLPGSRRHKEAIAPRSRTGTTAPGCDPIDASIVMELEERAKERAKGQAAPAETEPTAP